MAIDPDLRNWIILVIANTPLYLALGKFFFGDWAGFGESLKFWLMPDTRAGITSRSSGLASPAA